MTAPVARPGREQDTAPVCVLVGTMGAGKTTVGRLVADAIGVDFADSDELVEARAGKPVADIFVEDGESAFRALERESVADALATHPGVLSLGGGAVLDPATQALLAPHQVVFLRVGLADAVKRVGLGVGRPLLLGNVRSRVKQLLDERTPVYEGLARVSVDTDGRTADEVAADVIAALRPDVEEVAADVAPDVEDVATDVAPDVEEVAPRPSRDARPTDQGAPQ